MLSVFNGVAMTPRGLNVHLLSAINLSVVMLSVIVLTVVVPLFPQTL